ncbi:TRAP transporter substrate-binding protein [Martelella limonii]|uniref:TRAP transporter substrate-binding protein n=1 Tax=Martelella limonii TaxID=1647649 RepID=UPI0015806099|nr:TRAP transporter substrate-binding protein [Martelella limonii]
MRLSRREAIKLGAIGALATPFVLQFGRAYAAEYIFKIGTDGPLTDPTVREILVAAERIKERTNGTVEFQIFPNSALGAGTSMIGPVKSGAVEGYYLTSAILANVSPDAAISGIPFAFDSYEAVWKAMDGELGDQIKASVRAVGLEPFGKVLDLGFRQVLTNKPVEAVDDLDGVKLRVPQSPLYVGLFRSLGALPTPLNFSEVYPSLQTKIVDGTEGPLNVILNSKLYEVTKYIAMTNHMWDGFWLTMNPAFLERLPKESYDIVLEECNDAADRVRQSLVNDEKTSTETLMAKGITFTEPDIASFREKLTESGFYAEWKEKFSPETWAALEKAAGQPL